MTTSVSSSASNGTAADHTSTSSNGGSDLQKQQHDSKQPQQQQQQPSPQQEHPYLGLFAALVYAASSVLILLLNKVLLSNYAFKFPYSMALFHMLTSLISLYIMKGLGFINFAGLQWRVAKHSLPVSLTFIANIVLGMHALQLTNIPMFACLRRLTILLVLLFEYLLLNRLPSLVISGSICLMLTGSIIAGLGDTTFTMWGYVLVCINNIVTALNLVFIKKGEEFEGKPYDLLYYNSLLSLPVLLFFSIVTGELYDVIVFADLFAPLFLFLFISAALCSSFLNFATLWCTQLNSPLTTTVTGQVKNVLSSTLAIFIFHMNVSPLMWIGIAVGLSGSVVYGIECYRKDQEKRREREKAKQHHESIALTSITHTNGPTHDKQKSRDALLLRDPDDDALLDTSHIDIEHELIDSDSSSSSSTSTSRAIASPSTSPAFLAIDLSKVHAALDAHDEHDTIDMHDAQINGDRSPQAPANNHNNDEKHKTGAV